MPHTELNESRLFSFISEVTRSLFCPTPTNPLMRKTPEERVRWSSPGCLGRHKTSVWWTWKPLHLLASLWVPQILICQHFWHLKTQNPILEKPGKLATTSFWMSPMCSEASQRHWPAFEPSPLKLWFSVGGTCGLLEHFGSDSEFQTNDLWMCWNFAKWIVSFLVLSIVWLLNRILVLLIDWLLKRTVVHRGPPCLPLPPRLSVKN